MSVLQKRFFRSEPQRPPATRERLCELRLNEVNKAIREVSSRKPAGGQVEEVEGAFGGRPDLQELVD